MDITPGQRQAALDYLDARRDGEPSTSWTRTTTMRHRRVLRELAIDYSDVPIRSAGAPTRRTEALLTKHGAKLGLHTFEKLDGGLFLIRRDQPGSTAAATSS